MNISTLCLSLYLCACSCLSLLRSGNQALAKINYCLCLCVSCVCLSLGGNSAWTDEYFCWLFAFQYFLMCLYVCGFLFVSVPVFLYPCLCGFSCVYVYFVAGMNPVPMNIAIDVVPVFVCKWTGI